MPAAAKVDAEGLRVFARQMKALSPKLGLALSQELRDIGNEVRDKIRASTEAPYGPIDSEGKIGRKRKSVKTSATQRGVSIYSNEPDAAVWEWGGTVKPRGVPIRIPRTQFIHKQAEEDMRYIEERMGALLDGLAERYAGFTP